jgi:DNA processing protein
MKVNFVIVRSKISMISSLEKRARLQLARSENVGPVTYRALMQRFGSGERALEALPDLAKRGGGRTITLYPKARAEDEIAAIDKAGAHLLIVNTAPYPNLLAQTEDAPPILIAKGHVLLFDKPGLAVVGARNASAAGIRLARDFSAGLSARGYCIISGLARGIDAAAHSASLDGGTIACVAGGLDIFYPPENAPLYQDIGARGLLLAEQPLGTVPQGRHFPRRNRIIAGLSQGVLIVEAAMKSGSLITANYATEQGREVMAVPGSPIDPRANGCNHLIRNGATLVQSVEDIIEALAPLHGGPRVAQWELPFVAATAVADPSDSERTELHNFLSITPTPIDELIRLIGAAPVTVQMLLLELELAGRLVRHAGGRVALPPPSD